MKDEIKEILEDVKRHLDYVETTKQCSIRDNEMKAMYDYINNLQEQLIEYQKALDETTSEKIDLQEENKQTKLLKERYQLEKEVYKQRNEKAIEYVERVCESEKNINPYILHAPTLLNILNGDDEE